MKRIPPVKIPPLTKPPPRLSPPFVKPGPVAGLEGELGDGDP